jgi:exopolyphosphatase/guanosine-5'-triphosphate,3'-diphosphate pyrophosphatase
MTRFAAIDVGTNTVRLLVADGDNDPAYRPVHAEQVITRLGDRVNETGTLSATPMRRTLEALRRYAETARTLGAEEIIAVATSAGREATNRQEFLDRARVEAGVEVRVISAEIEATMTALGVAHALGPKLSNLLIVDIGGGSTEFIGLEGGTIAGFVSLPIGVVKLTETYLRSDPPSSDEIDAASIFMRARLREVPASLRHPPGAILAGTAGTPTTLAAIDLGLVTYDGARVTGHRLSRGRIQQLLDYLCSLPLADRRQVVGLEPARADVIVAGTLLTREILDVFGFDELTVSDGGLREGLLLHHLSHRQRAL